MTAIRKITIWHNSTPLGKGPRWDMEIEYADKHRIRHTRVKMKWVKDYVTDAFTLD